MSFPLLDNRSPISSTPSPTPARNSGNSVLKIPFRFPPSEVLYRAAFRLRNRTQCSLGILSRKVASTASEPIYDSETISKTRNNQFFERFPVGRRDDQFVAFLALIQNHFQYT